MKYLFLVLLLTGCYSRESDEATKAVNGLRMSVEILNCTVKVTKNNTLLKTEAETCDKATQGNKEFCFNHLRMFIDQQVVKCLQDNH